MNMNIVNRHSAKTIETLIELRKQGAFDDVAKQLATTQAPKIKSFQPYTEVELTPKLQEKFAQYKAQRQTPYSAEEVNQRLDSKLKAYKAQQARTIAIA